MIAVAGVEASVGGRVPHGTGAFPVPPGSRWYWIGSRREDTSVEFGASSVLLQGGEAVLVRSDEPIGIARTEITAASRMLGLLENDVFWGPVEFGPIAEEVLRLGPARFERVPFGSTAMKYDSLELIAAIDRELGTGVLGGAAIADALSRALVVHLIRSDPPWDWPDGVVLRVLAELLHSGAVPDVESIAGIPARTFSRRFRAMVGRSPRAHARWWRIARARSCFITDPSASVDSVAQEVGYRSTSAFIAAFRAEVDRTPAAWVDELDSSIAFWPNRDIVPGR